MTAKEIQRTLAVRHWDYRAQVVVPNCCFAGWEADLLVLYPSGWLQEVEIKISASDFRREFTAKEEKHKRIVEGGKRSVWNEEFEALRGNPFLDVAIDSRGREMDYGYLGGQPHLIKHFWFAMPTDLALKLESQIPDHAGLLAVDRRQVTIVKKAPKLGHARVLTETERMDLMRLAYLRFWTSTRPSSAPIANQTT